MTVDARPRGVQITAILAARDHRDTIAAVIGDLVAQGIRVCLIDRGSRDGTIDEAKPFLDRGLLSIEQLAGDDEALVRRKEQLARTLDADWLLHGDADELREGPWSDRDLAAAIATVDQLGYNAIDFQLFHFPPTRAGFGRGDSLRDFHRYFEPAAGTQPPRISCWKKHDAIDLESTSGAEARLPWQRVFPVRFIARKYELGGAIRDPRDLRRFDPEAARLHLWLNHAVVDELRRELAALKESHGAREAELRGALAHKTHEATELAAELRRLRVELDTTWAQVQELLQSRTWRWTRPARLALRLMGKP